MQKVGRNEPCSCGSGKKYKNCHLKAENGTGESESKSEQRLPKANTFKELIQNYNCNQILKIIAVLQLQPANHKKYLRLEQMARLTLLELKNKQEHRYYAYWDLLKNAIYTFTEYNYLEEDPPTLFTENVVFLHGNYIVYPGFNVTATKILNELFECIFLVENKLDEKFKTLIKDAAGLMLLLSNSMGTFLGHKRFLYDPSEGDELQFPEYDDVFKYLDAISFSKEFLQKNSEFYMFDRSILKEFIISHDNKGLDNDDPDENTAALFPLIEIDGETILYLPSGILPALTNFIYAKAEEFVCQDEINRILTERQFEKTILALKHIGWKKLNFELPEVKQNANIQEAIFQFDTQKMAYLYFINPRNIQNNGEHKNLSSNSFGERNEEIISVLSKIATEHIVEILTLYVFAETGGDFMFAWPKSSGGHLSIPITYNELDAICYSEKSNALNLWQFVKTYTRTNFSVTINTPGGTLDAYVAYIDNYGSFFNSEEETPKGTNIFIPVGYSNDFLREVLHRQDEHAVTLLYKQQKAFTKVIRYKQYAPIYKQKENIIEYKDMFRLVIETFKMPIWITSIIDDNEWAKFTCEGIAFWLNKMETVLSPVLNKLTYLQFEFNIIIDKKLRQQIEFENVEIDITAVKFKIDIKPPIIEIFVPYEFLYLVQRRDNLSDKTLMKTVLEGLVSYLVEARQEVILTPIEITEIIDQVLVPSNAKMFLFTDTSTNLKRDDRDLPPLRRVNDAAVSFILESIKDILPQNILIPEIIQSDTEKRNLCNSIVASLNNEIAKKVEFYDGVMLLELLIKINEKCIQVREAKEILIPAKISSFSTFEDEVEEFYNGENLVQTNQALRILIEYVAVKIPTGNKWPNYDEVEDLMSMVDQVISWGSLSDSIWKKLHNPKMGLLPSGRIGTEKFLQNNFLGPLSKAQTTSELFRYVKTGLKTKVKNHQKKTMRKI
ncbi:MAG: SEC-C domain-containing protein [Ferruginibacter sp.]